jgi:hypothetical protein
VTPGGNWSTLLRQEPHLSRKVWLTTSRQLRNFVSKHTGAWVAHKAVAELRTMRLEFSARLSYSDLTFLPLFVISLIVGAFLAGAATMALAVALVMALIFIG